jgi:hypothetical protein
MLKKTILISLLAPALYCMSQEAPVIKGAVSKPGAIDAKAVQGLNKYKRLVKIADSKGNFLGSLELSGYALKDVLERREIKKQDDGFNKLLDLYVTAKGQDGKSVVFSYGETFLASDEGMLLADSVKMVLPTHHPPLEAGKNDPTIISDIKKRNSINLNGCISCHDGEAYSKLYFPKGWLLVAAQDGFAGRFVENLAEINIAQVGIEVKDTRSSGGRESIIESPLILGLDGKSHEFSQDAFQKLPRLSVSDAGVGIGKGYRGTSTWEGVALKGLLQSLMPTGVNPKNTYVLVTGADGYRATFSGTEVFNDSDEKCVLLIDIKDGKPLGKGSGRYTVIQRADFFVDRNVRMVKEIRLVVVE